MPVKKISITDFISMSESHLVVDVRSPGEFAHAHLPNAVNIPLFTDEERREVGITYKQKGKQKAIKIGLDYFGPRMKEHIDSVETALKQHRCTTNTLLLHCWRGGMRSGGMAWLFDLYGFDVYVLAGGYKAFRKWVLTQFEAPYDMTILGGFTGSSKTDLLHELVRNGENIIDLEGLARHKGSAFGGIGQAPQPSQEMFENQLAIALSKMNNNGNLKSFWLEDESQRIGNMVIPHPLWKTIRTAPVFFMETPFEARLDYILKHYGNLDKQALINAILRIQKRLGPNETKTSINFILENNIKEAFTILLEYYDKTYEKSLYNRDNPNELIKKVTTTGTDPETNYQILKAYLKRQQHAGTH